jgi:hypothetical protein
MRATNAPSTPQIRLHPDAAAVEVQALYRGVVIGTRCLIPEEASAFLIGCAKGVDAPVAAGLLAADSHPLVAHGAGGFAVELTDQMTGTVIFEDRSAPLEELLRTQGPHFTTPPAARLQIDCGEVAFLVSSTAAPILIPRPAWARMKDHWPALVAAVAALLTLLLVAFLPPDMRAITGEDLAYQKRMLTTTIIPPIPPTPPPGPAGAAAAPSGGAARHTGGGGAAGPARRPPAARKVAKVRPQAPADYSRRGVLGVLLAYNGDSLSAVLNDSQALIPGALDGLDNSVGPGTGPGFGPGHGGIDTSGTGGPLAGNGPGNMIGTCDAECRGRELNAYRTIGQLRNRRATGPQIAVGVPRTQGTLDKEIVRRIIRQHINEVKFCYEQQLPRHPDLAGRITVQFTIAAAGTVGASLVQASSLNNVAVESCITQAVRRWEFPQRAVGATIVSYPFVLVPAGAP